MKKFIVSVLAIALIMSCLFAFSACDNADSAPIAIGVQAGTTGEAYVKGDADWGFAGISNSKASSYENIALAINDIKNGNIKYAVVDKVVAEEQVKSNSDLLKIVPVDLTVEKYAIGVDKNNAQLLNSINTIINRIKTDGTLDAIYAAYDTITISEDESTGSVPASEIYTGITNGNSAASNKLVVATNAAFAPYEYKVGTKFYGIDMEIAKIIATELDLELVINDMDFSAVVTSVQSGLADIALACLTVNAVREQSVTFSVAYEEGAAQVLIVKKDDAAFDNCKTAADVDAVFKNMK